MATYAIRGVHTGIVGGAFPLRQEIDTWSANPENNDQVNLFLQALASFQQVSPRDKLSYFQLAGIHGEPFQPWDEITNPNPRTRWRGYCTHASVLFPTWHRPYIAAFEQILHEIMTRIAASYPIEYRARYQAAAEKFRFPYWDFAQLKERGGRRSLNVPYLCTLPTIEVFTPTGTAGAPGTVQIDNPLYSFKFPAGSSGITSFQDRDGNFFPFATVKGTSRYPPQHNPRNPVSLSQWDQGFVDNDAITEALRNLSSLGEDVYRSFTTNNYTWYSSTQQSNPPAPDSYQSLESIHNEIHGLTGGGGHMSWNTVSSFDPIFWLHHCNVDRLFAIWQAIYPNSWFDAPASQLRDERGTWSIPAGTRETPQTPLTPFHSDERGSGFDSDDIRDWTRFGSSYPELQPWLPKYRDATGQFNPTLYRNDIVQQVTNTYSRVRSRVQRSTVPQSRLFATAQSGPQSLGGTPAPTTQPPQFAPQPQFAPPTSQAPPAQAQMTSPQVPPVLQFAPPPTQPAPVASQSTPAGQQFAPPPTVGQQFAPPPTAGQQFSPPPTTGQQFAPPPTTGQQFAPPPTTGQQQQFSPAPTTGQQFAPPPTAGQQFSPPPSTAGQQFAPPPTTHETQGTPQPPAQEQFVPPTPQGQQPPAQQGPQAHPVAQGPKPSGLKGLMFSAQKHFDEAMVAGREASQGGQLGQQRPPGQPPVAQPGQSANSASAFATKFGGMVGSGLHMAQERLGSKKNTQGGKQRGIGDDEFDQGDEALSRGFGDLNLQSGQGPESLTYHEYDCNIRFERFDLGGRPFTVHIFLGDFNPNPATWMWDHNRVGGIYNFVAGVARGDGSACSNCEQQSEDRTIVTGQVSLTNAILDDIEDGTAPIQSLLPEEVIPYLKDHLHWRITDPNGREIERQQISSLKISVTECSATLPSNPGEFIHYGPCRVLDFVTTGRPGGKAPSDGF